MSVPEWHRRAACRGADPKIFFPTRKYTNEYNEAIMAYCKPCPVQAECGLAGKSESWGIWAGELHSPPEPVPRVDTWVRKPRDPVARAAYMVELRARKRKEGAAGRGERRSSSTPQPQA